VERIFEISRLADGTGLKLAGELDLHSAQELAAALTAFQEVDEVWIDMRRSRSSTARDLVQSSPPR